MKIAVFCGSRKARNPKIEVQISRLGALMGDGGHDLVYGGSNKGFMGTISDAVSSHGGGVIGIIPSFFSDEVIYSQRYSELIIVDSLASRKAKMLQMADAFVVLPGGVGTLDELTEVQAANQLQLCHKPIALLNVDGFFNSYLLQLRMMVLEGLFEEEQYQSLLLALEADEVLPAIENWMSKTQNG